MTFYDLWAEPAATNIAWQWVNLILPSDASSPWGKALAVFSSALVFIATSMLAWITVTGIVQSAYTGKVLGENSIRYGPRSASSSALASSCRSLAVSAPYTRR